MAIHVTAAEARAYQLNLDGEAEEVTPKPQRNHEEETAQIALFTIRKIRVERYPDLRWMYSTLNGIYIPKPLLRQVAAAGLTPGVLDIRIDVPHVDPNGTHWAGLCLDLKAKDGTPSKEQLAWADQLIACGIRTHFCKGDKKAGYSPLQDAWWTIANYLNITGPDNFNAHLTPNEQYTLATLTAEANLARSTASARKEADQQAKALQQATQSPTKPATPGVTKKP